MKERKTTAQVLVDCLEAEGVDVMFGIPGEETLDLMFAIRDSKIRFIPVRHEQGAAFMADVYGRLTGRAGVCLSTLGPGATNLVTGVADAYLDGAPLVAITGQVGCTAGYTIPLFLFHLSLKAALPCKVTKKRRFAISREASLAFDA